MTFRPTYLMIKRHKLTGLMYFCKTTEKNYEKYKGSGRYWKSHLRIHGRLVETVWHQLFENKDELTEFALFFSEFYDIVNAKDKFGNKIWANEIPEDGLQGGQNKGLSGPGVTFYGRKHSSESKKLMTFPGEKNGMYGRKHSAESIQKMKDHRPDQSGGKNPCAKKCHVPLGNFECIADAAKAMNLSEPTIRKRLNSTDEKYQDYYFRK